MEIFCSQQSFNSTALRSASDLSRRIPYSSAAHCSFATNHFRKSDPYGLCAGPRLGLEFAGILECFVFFRPRNAQLVDRRFATYLSAVFVAFYILISLHPDWDGLSSYGNRFFVSLTPIFVLGLAAFFDWLGRAWQEHRAAIFASSVTAALIAWNLGLIFQWGMHLIPARGPISWREAAYNQVAVVPAQTARTLKAYLTGRGRLMGHIEQEDLQQIKERNEKPSD